MRDKMASSSRKMASASNKMAAMKKQDSSWRRVECYRVICLVLVLHVSVSDGKQMSETLQRALSAVRGPSPGAKKLLNIPEDGDDEDPEVVPMDEPALNQEHQEVPVPGPSNDCNEEVTVLEDEESLDPEILQILGEDPTDQKAYGENLHKDIALRWSFILTNGMTKENKTELIKQYLPSENCVNMKAPILNLEIKAALTEINLKRDLYSQSKQNQLSSCLAAISKALNWALSSKDPKAQEIIKPLGDAGRLLCDSHYRESQSRRYAIINTLNKQTRETVKNTKLDEYLFGSNLADHIKSSKAIIKSGSEMKSTIQRAPFKQPPTTQNRGALNSRGMPPRPAAGEQRQNPALRRPAAAPRDRRHETYRRPPVSRQRPRRR